MDIDSIVGSIGSKQPDTSRIDYLNELHLSLFMNHPGKMLLYADTAIILSIQLNDSLRLAKSYNRKGVAYHFIGDLNNALQYFLKSINVKEKLGRHDQLIPEYNNIGMVLRSLGQPKESLKYYMMAMQLCQQCNDKSNEAKIWNNIGTTYRQLKQFDEAQKAYEQALVLNESLFELESHVININNLGNLYKEKKEYQKALKFYNKAIAKIEGTNNYYIFGLVLNNLSELFILNNQFILAKETLIKSSALIDSVENINLRMNNHKLWSEYYERVNEFDKALLSRKKYEQIKDSLAKIERSTIFMNLKSLAESERKLVDMELLKTINTIQKKQLSNQRFIQIGAILFSILLLITLLLLIKYIKVKDKLNNSLQKLVDEKTSELKKAKVQAEKSDQLKTAFLSNISHEVRTPMNAIVGFSNLIINQDLGETERNQFLTHINTNTLRLLKLFENVTHLAKFEQQEVKFKNEQFYPCRVVNNIIHKIGYNPQTLEHLNRIKNLIPEETQISTDKEIFSMIMDELLDNAIKFTSEGDIIITGDIQNNSFKLSVKDQGIGISKEQLPNVYDKFTKFETSLIPGYDGPGIGLSICKRGIRLLSGNIKIDSEKEKGTSVFVTIPL